MLQPIATDMEDEQLKVAKWNAVRPMLAALHVLYYKMQTRHLRDPDEELQGICSSEWDISARAR